MRIGILTFHRARNYGAFLQAYALKTFVSDQGHDVELIDYWPQAHADTYKLFNPNWKRRTLKNNVLYLILFLMGYVRARKRKTRMDNLVFHYLGVKENSEYQNPITLRHVKVDCVIYGSDQIWWKSTLYGGKGFDAVYWGEFIDHSIRKISYAPSMGVIDLNEDDRQQIKKYLLNFELLSVREIGLKNVISDLTKKKISVVLDPVFLLSKDQWMKFCRPVQREKYILYYNLMKSVDADMLVEKLKQKLCCVVVEVTGRVYPLKLGRRYVQTVDAIEFISLIKNAEFVITTSFHGAAFSILFEKQFYALGMAKNSGRVESLLEILEIGDRLLDSSVYSTSSIIDYSVVRKKLQSIVGESRAFLTSGLS